MQQVQGILKIANPFSNPFTAFCPKCEHKFEGFGVLNEQTTHCIRCNKNVTYVHKLHLKTLLFTDRKKPIQCFIPSSLVEQLIPSLCTIKYEEYMHDKEKVVFILRELSIEGTFTLSQTNAIKDVNLMQTNPVGQKVS